MNKTIAMKLLEKRSIPFDVVSYTDTERDAELIALEYLEVEPNLMFKTLVVLPQTKKGKRLLVMIPADRQLNLKTLAKQIGEKKLAMASHAEAEKLTGLKVGGISPLSLLNKGFKMYIDQSAEALETLYISSGQKGMSLNLKAADLIALTNAKSVKATD